MNDKISRRSFLGSVAAVALAPALPLNLVGGGKGGADAYMVFKGIPLSDFGHQFPVASPISTTLSWPCAEIPREGGS